MIYLTHFNKRKTPQNEAIPGSAQVPNSAGGYAWEMDDWTRLRRFLILGSQGGSYYISERTLTRENAAVVERCIVADGIRVVQEIVAISEAGRAPKNDPALFALAMAAGLGDDVTRRAALEALPKVARIGTHLFHFAAYVEGFRGWGRGLRTAIANWYGEMPNDQLALQLLKYRQRDGWSHRDLLRLAHPKTADPTRNALFHWSVDGWEGVGEEPHPDEVLKLIWAFERLQKSSSTKESARLVSEYRLPMEAVPSEKRSREVWEALLPHCGLTFLFRNLGNLSKAGVLGKGSPESTSQITIRLTDESALKRARIHPIQVLSALTVYGQGHGARSDGQWDVAPEVVDALDKAFYLSFGNVTSTGKRWVLGLDVSGSMSSGQIAGVPGLSPRVGSVAMSMVTYQRESNVSLVAFTAGAGGATGGKWGGGQSGLTPLSFSGRQRLDDIMKATSQMPFGGTDCALPMIWAAKNKIKADAFVIYTDSETWHGDIHPAQALREYRDKMGIPARLIVVGMVSNGFTIADPNDSGMLDIVGFDTSSPEVISQFACGNI